MSTSPTPGPTSAETPRPARHPARVLVGHEVRLLLRYRIAHAAAFVSLVWIVVLAALPQSALPTALALVVVGEAAVVGLFFVAGLHLFERDERTADVFAVAPVSPSLRLALRIAVLVALSIAVALVLALAAMVAGHPGVRWGLLATGTAGLAVLALLVGHLVVERVASVTDYVIAVQGPLLPLALPLLHLLGWVPGPWWWLVPSHGPLVLVAAGAGGPPPGAPAVAAAVGIPALTALGLGAASRAARGAGR